MRRPLTRPGGRTTDLHRSTKVDELQPGDATKIYRLGYAAGQASMSELKPGDATTIYKLGYGAGQQSMSTDAKLLKDEWWKGYATGLTDAYEPGDEASPIPADTLDGAGQEPSPGHAPTRGTRHRLTLLPGGGSVPRRRARREHLRLHHGGAS